MYEIKETLPFSYGLFSDGKFLGPVKETSLPSIETMNLAGMLCPLGGVEKPISEHTSFIGDLQKVSDTEFAIRIFNRTTRDYHIRYYMIRGDLNAITR